MDDLDAFAAQRADPDVVRYLYDEPMTRAEAARRLAELRAELTCPDTWMNLAVELLDVGTVIGAVGLNLRSDVHRQAEIGYVFDRAASGRGYATEAVRAIVDLAFRGLGVHRVIARLDARNLPSARLCTRLGLREEAHLVESEFVKGEWCDELTYAVLDREWHGHEGVAEAERPTT